MRNTMKFITIFVITLLAYGVINAQVTQSLTYGETITGSLNNDSYEQIYTFEGQAGDTILITMRSTSLDSFLYLRDVQGEDLIADDDSAGSLNSLIGPYELPETGTYTVVATRFQQENGTGTGDYELNVRLADFVLIEIDETIETTINPQNSILFYTLTAESSDIYEINYAITDGVGNAELSVRDSQNNYISSVYIESQYNTDNFTVVDLDAGQTVTVALRYDYAHDNSGNRIEDQAGINVEFVIKPIVAEALTVTLGEPTDIIGVLEDQSDVAYYTFNATSGQTISMDGFAQNDGNFEFYVMSPDGYGMYYASTYYEQPMILVPPQVVNQTGEFLLVIHRGSMPLTDNAPETVTYEIVLNLTTTPELTLNEPVVGSVQVNNGVYENAYIYNGLAGEEITVSLSSADDNYQPAFSMEYAPSNNEPIDVEVNPVGSGGGGQGGGGMHRDFTGFYVNFGASHTGTVTYQFILPYDGVYIIRINSGGYQAEDEIGQYSLVIETN